jgi:MFS family permease
MTPITGRLSDLYGKKKILLIILGIYAIGISVAALSNNITAAGEIGNKRSRLLL